MLKNYSILNVARLKRGLVCLAMSLIVSSPALAEPRGGVIVRGDGSISQPSSNMTVINQNTAAMVAEWASFNLSPSQVVKFIQPGASSVVLNQILDQNPSQIMGVIDANGRVFLANPNGIIFGNSANINVGSLVATSLTIDNDAFMRGEYRFGKGQSGAGAVINRGSIRAADGGSVTMIGARVANEGTIVANLGQINLTAGKVVVLDFNGDALLGVEIEEGLLAKAGDDSAGGEDAVLNTGELIAQGGTVMMSASTARDVYTNLVNNEGLITASRIDTSGGKIRLLGDGPGDILNSGELLATGMTGGDIQVTGENVNVSGRIDASGRGAGGRVLIGGDYQGKGALANASNTTITASAQISADAIQTGKGGEIIVWSDGTTVVNGTLSARGGAEGGDGGFIETSGKQVLEFTTAADVSAPEGEAGTWLLDPENIDIDGAKAATIETALNNGSNVEIKTSAEGEEQGDITVNAAIEKTAGADASLTLDAHGDIDVNQSISSTSNKLDVNLKAGKSININAPISTNGGALTTALAPPQVEDPPAEDPPVAAESPLADGSSVAEQSLLASEPVDTPVAEAAPAPVQQITVAADVSTNGGAIQLDSGVQGAAASANQAASTDTRITVESGVTLSTRAIAGSDQANDLSSADSGLISIQARSIEIKDGARLFAQADSGFSSGDINIEASINEQRLTTDAAPTPTDLGINEVEASVSIVNADIRGDDVMVSARAETAVDYNDFTVYVDGEEFADVTGLLEPRLGSFGSKEVVGGVAVARSTASVDISGGNIEAVGDTILMAEAVAEVNFGTLQEETDPGVFERTRTDAEALSLAYGETLTLATVDIRDAATINTGGDVLIDAQTDNTTMVMTGALRSAKRRPTGTDKKLDLTLAVSETQATSRVDVGTDTVINAIGDLSVQAEATKEVVTASTANTFRDGTLRQAVALEFSDVNVDASLSGEATAENIDVLAGAHSSTSTVGALSGFKGKAKEIKSNGIGGRQESQEIIPELNRFFLSQLLGFDLRVDPTGLDQISDVVGGPDITDNVTQRLLKFQVPGAIAFTDDTMLADARVADGAALKSTGNIKIEATILDEDSQNFAQTKLKKSLDSSAARDKDNTRNLAIVLTNHSNTANASIGKGAQVDAGQALTVNAESTFPNPGFDWPDMSVLTDLSGIETALQDITDTGAIKDAFNEQRDEMIAEGDILAGLVTTSAKAHGVKNTTAELLGIAGSVNIFNMDNNANALIDEGALINQDDAYASANQDVAVTANARVETVSLAGNIGAIPPQTPDGNNNKFLGLDRASRDTSGVGSSYLDYGLKNNASAVIANAVQLKADQLDVNSDAQFSNLSISISAGPAEKYGVKGAVSITGVDSDSLAQISDGAVVEATAVDVRANNSTVVDLNDPVNDLLRGNINIAVAQLKDASRPASSGGSSSASTDRIVGGIALNDMNRNSIALIGSQAGQSADAGVLTADTLSVVATSKGDIRSYSASILDQSNTSTTNSGGANAPGESQGQDVRNGRGNSFGLNISADASINTISDNTIASINGLANVNATGNIELEAINESGIFAIAGAVTRSAQNNGSAPDNTTNTDKGLVGAFTLNSVDGLTSANISDATVQTDSVLSLLATRISDIFTIAASGTNSADTDLIGSIAYNEIDIDTEARISEADIDVGSTLDVRASNAADIFAIGGAAQIARSGARRQQSSDGGAGAGLSINALSNDTYALIEDSQLDVGSDIMLNATSGGEILAVAASILKGPESLISGAITWNEIDNTTEAVIRDGRTKAKTVNAGRDITIRSSDDSIIQSIAGAIASSENKAIGASVAYNEIATQTLAGIDNATVDAQDALVIAASSQSQIDTLVAGFTKSAGDGVSASLAINDINTRTDAFVTQGAKVTVGAGGADINAISNSNINMLAVTIASTGSAASGAGGSMGQNQGQDVVNGAGTNFGIGISGDVAINTIRDVTSARIDMLSELISDAELDLLAMSSSDIDVITGAMERSNDPDGTGIAGAYSKADIFGRTSATIDNARTTSTANTRLTAERSGDIFNIAAGVATGGALDLAGSASHNEIAVQTLATLKNADSQSAHLDLNAVDSSNIFAIGGAVTNQGGGSGNSPAGGRALSGGLGAGIAINNIANQTRASLDNSQIETGDLALTASSTGVIEAIAGAAAKGSDNMLTGAVAWNEINNRTEAVIVEGLSAGKSIHSGGDLSLLAVEKSRISALSAQISKTDSSAIGASVAYNQIGNYTGSTLSNADIDVSGDTSLNANSTGFIETLVGGLLKAGGSNLSGSVAINDIATITESAIRARTNIQSDGAVSLTANADNDIDVLAVTIAAAGSASSSGGSAGGSVAQSPLTAVFQSFGLNLSGNVVLNTIKTQTRAEILDNSTVQSDSAVTLSAANDSSIDAISGAIQSAGTGSNVGAAGAYTRSEISDTTVAAVRQSAVDAGGQLMLSADHSGQLFNIAVGGSKGGRLNLAGSVSQNIISNVTAVDIADARIRSAADVNLRADDQFDILGVGGAVSLGGQQAGLGAGISLSEVSNVTRARISSSDIEIGGALNLSAINSGNIWAVAAALARSENSLAGAVSINNIDNRTEALLDDNRTVIQASQVSLTAQDGLRAASDTNAPRPGIHALAGAVGLGNNAGIGGAAAINNISSETRAGIRNTVIDTNGIVDVRANNDAFIETLVGGAAVSDSAAISVSVAKNDITTLTQAQISDSSLIDNASAVNVVANTDSDIDVLAISVSVAGVKAGGSSGDGSAQQSSQGGFGIGVSGDVVLNNIADNTVAIVDESELRDVGAVEISALKASEIDAIAGAVSLRLKSRGASVAGAYVQNDIGGLALAKVVDSTVSVSSLGVAAQSNSMGTQRGGAPDSNDVDITNGIFGIAAGGALGGDAGLAGSVVNSRYTRETQAEISNSVVNASANVKVDALDDSDIFSIGGAIAVGSKGGVGAGLAINDMSNQTRAVIANSNIESGGRIDVISRNEGDISAIAGAVAAGKNAALAGAFSFNKIASVSQASIEGDRGLKVVRSVGDTRVSASDDSAIHSLSGSVALSGVAIGLSAAYNEIGNNTLALIDGATVESSAGSVIVDADSDAFVETLVAGVSLAGTAAVSGSAAITQLRGVTASKIRNAAVSANNNVLVLSDANNEIDALVAGLQVSSNAGIGGAAMVNVLDNQTIALIDGASVIDALGQGDVAQINSGNLLASTVGNASTLANSSSAVSAPTTPDVSDDINPGEFELGKGLGARETELVRGVAVSAVSSDDIESLTVNLAGGGSAGVSAVAAVNVINSTVDAGIRGNSRINQDQSGAGSLQQVAVNAGNFTAVNTYGGGAGVGLSGAGIGAAASINITDKTTIAQVANSQVSAKRDIALNASSSNEFSGLMIGLGLGGAVGVAGSASVIKVDNLTLADVYSSQLNSNGDIGVTARDRSDIDLLSGSVAGAGAVAVGAAVDVVVAESTTRASISGDSEVNARGTLEVNADNEVDIYDISVAGGVAGTVAVSAGVGVKVINTTTDALIGNGVRVNQDVAYRGAQQDVKVIANDSATLNSAAVAVALSGVVAGGAGVDVVVMNNTVNAYIGGQAKVDAGRDVLVSASSDKDVSSLTLGIAGSGKVAVGGAVSIISIGTSLDADGASELNNPDSENYSVNDIDGQFTANPFVDDSGENLLVDENSSAGNQRNTFASGVNRSVQSGTNNLSVGGAFSESTPVPQQGTNAYVDLNAMVRSGRDVVVTASNTTDTAVVTGGIGAAGIVGAGAGVAIVNVNDQTRASVKANATIGAGRNVTIKATDGHADPDQASTVTAAAGGAGLVGLGAAVAVQNRTSNTEAYLGSNAKIERAATVNIEAMQLHNLDSQVVNIVLGAAALGGSYAQANSDATVQAYVGSNGMIGDLASSSMTVGDLVIKANSGQTAVANAVIVTGGVVGANGSSTQSLVNTDVDAYIGSGAKIVLSGDTQLEAEADVESRVKVDGVSGGVGAISVSDSKADATVKVAASIKDGANLTGNALTMKAIETTELKSEAYSAGGGLIAVQIGGAKALADSTIETVIDDNTEINLSGDASLLADSELDVNAKVSAASGGVIAVTVGDATAESTQRVAATVGGQFKARSLSIDANEQNATDDVNHWVEATSSSASGGGVAVSASGAAANATSNIKAAISDNAIIDTVLQTTLNSRALQQVKVDVSAATGGIVAVSAGTVKGATASVSSEALIGKSVGVAARNITLDAYSKNQVDNTLSNVGGGAVSVNAGGSDSVAITNTKAQIDENADIATRGLLKVVATAEQIANAKVSAAGGGLASINSGKVKVTSTVNVDAVMQTGGLLDVGSLTIDADGSNLLEASVKNEGGGLISVNSGGLGTNANLTVNAKVSGVTGDSKGAVQILAKGLQSSTVYGKSAGGGFVSIAGADVASAATQTVAATLGTGTDSELNVGSLNLDADAENLASAESEVASGGFVATGTAKVSAIGTTTVTAAVSDNANINASGDIELFAGGRHRIKARSQAETGGFVAVASSDADGDSGVGAGISAEGNLVVTAETGSNVTLSANDISLRADANVARDGSILSNDRDTGYGVFADAYVLAGGFVGITGTSISAASNPSVYARLGSDNLVNAVDVLIGARRHAYVDTDTRSVAGGFVGWSGLTTSATIGGVTVSYEQIDQLVTVVSRTPDNDSLFVNDTDRTSIPENLLSSNYPSYRSVTSGPTDTTPLYVQYTDSKGRIIPVKSETDTQIEVTYSTVELDVGDGDEFTTVLVNSSGTVIGVEAANGSIYDAELDSDKNVVLVLDADDKAVKLTGVTGLLTRDAGNDIANDTLVSKNSTTMLGSLIPVLTEKTIVVTDYDNPIISDTSYSEVVASVGAKTRVIAGGNINIDARGNARAKSFANGVGGGFVAGSVASSDTRILSDVRAVAGDDSILIAQKQSGGLAGVTLLASSGTEGYSDARASVGGGFQSSTPTASTSVDSKTTAWVGERATIKADNVLIKSVSKKLVSLAESKVHTAGFEATSTTRANASATAPVVTRINTDARITGRNQVDLIARFRDVSDGIDGRIKAYTSKTGSTILDFGTNLASVKADLDSWVVLEQGAEITTLDMNFEAKIFNSTAVRAQAETNSALIDPNTSNSSSARARVYWDGKVIMADSVEQVLLIHEDGRIETLSGQITASYDAQGNIVVADLEKGQLGKVRVFAERPDYGHDFVDGIGITAIYEHRSGINDKNVNGFILNKGDLEYSNIFPSVKIVNLSDSDLKVGKIVLASPDSALPEFIVTTQNQHRLDADGDPLVSDYSANRNGTVNFFNRRTDTDGFSSDPAVIFGDENDSNGANHILTITEVDGDRSVKIFGASEADIILTNLIDSEENVAAKAGSVLLSNTGGKILSEGSNALIETHQFDARAYQNNIGDTNNYIDINLTQDGGKRASMAAFADGDIFLSTRFDNKTGTGNPGVDIGNITSSSEIHLLLGSELNGRAAPYYLDNTVQAIDLVDIRMGVKTLLGIGGTVMAGVENYVVDINAAGQVSLDISNINNIGINEIFNNLDGTVRSPAFRSYTDAEWFGFETTTDGNTIALPDIVQRGGRINIQGDTPASGWLSKDGRLKALQGYSHVTINNNSDKNVELHTIDLDRPVTAAIQVNSDTRVESNEYDLIGVETFGNASGLIDVNSSQATDVILAERLLNSSGLTDINTAGGDIRQIGATQLIKSREIDFRSEAGNSDIGNASQAIRIDLQGGDLLAIARKDIYIEEIDGDLNLELAYTGNQVSLIADRSLLDTNGNVTSVLGTFAELIARNGRIDTDLLVGDYLDARAATSIDLLSRFEVPSLAAFDVPLGLRNINAGTDLSIVASDITDVEGSNIRVNGLAKLTASNGNIVLGDKPGDRVNFGSLTFSGGNVDISEDSDMRLVGENAAGGTLGLAAQGDIRDDSGAVLTATGVSRLQASGDIILDNVGNDYQAAVNSDAVNTTLVDVNAIDLGDSIARNVLNVTALNGSITDSGTAAITGITNLRASGDIMLDSVGNDFMAAVNSDGQSVTLVDRNDVELGTTRANGDLNVTAKDGSISDSASGAGALVSGVTRLWSEVVDLIGLGEQIDKGDIVLDNVLNDFRGTVNTQGEDVLLVDSNRIALGTSTAHGGLTVRALNGDISDSGTATVDGVTVLRATGDIIMDTASNDFRGEVNSDGQSVILVDRNDIELGSSQVRGDLTVTAKDGSISDSETGAGALVAGVTRLWSEIVDLMGLGEQTDKGDIVLDNALNDFQGVVNTAGEDVVLIDANDIELGTSTAQGGLRVTALAGSISDSGTATIDGVTHLLATDDITLNTAANDFRDAVNSDAVNVTLVDANDIELGDSRARGKLNVTALSGNITDSESASVDSASNLIASGDISLDTQANDFRGTVNSRGVNITLVDANDIELGTTIAAGDLDITARNGAISDTGEDGFNEGFFALAQIDGFVQNQGATVAGDTNLRSLTIDGIRAGRTTDKGDIVLDNVLNDFQGTVNSDGEDITLVDANDIELGRSRAQGQLNVRAISGSISDSGVQTVELDSNLIAKQDISLDSRQNDFEGRVNSDGVNTTLVDANDILLGTSTASGTLDVEAITGAITDVGAATVDGVTTLLARGEVRLDTRANDFRDAVFSDAANIHLVDANDILLGNNISRRAMFVEAITGGISDIPGAIISVPRLGDFLARGDIQLGDNAGDSTNFGDLTLNGRHAYVQEDSATNFANSSRVASLQIISAGDITDTGVVDVRGNSLIRAYGGQSIYLNTKTSTYRGSVVINGVGGLIHNLEFIDATPLYLPGIRTTGFIDIAALGQLDTSAQISANGDISLNGYGGLSVGSGGISGGRAVNLSANDGGFGPGLGSGSRNIVLNGGVSSSSGRISLIADGNIVGGGLISTPADASLWSTNGQVGSKSSAINFNIGGAVSVYQSVQVAYVTGTYREANAWVFRAPISRNRFFDDVFFRGLPVLTGFSDDGGSFRELFYKGVIYDPLLRDLPGSDAIGKSTFSQFDPTLCNGVSLYEQNEECQPVEEEAVLEIDEQLYENLIINSDPELKFLRPDELTAL